MQLSDKDDLRNIIIFFLLTFLSVGIIYFYTMAPTVTFGDSGNFITAAVRLRIAHPPGYPTYLLLAKIFSVLPIGTDIAYRINLLSVFFASLSVAFTYLLIYRILIWYCLFDKSGFAHRKESILLIHISATSGALILGFTATFWSQALIAEVHSLHAYLTVIMLFLLLYYGKTGDLRYWYSVILIWGISLGNHHTSILYLPVGIIFLYLTGRLKEILSIKILLTGIGLSLLGFLIYLYIPLVSARMIMVDWGRGDNWSGFKTILLRSDYGAFQISRTWDIFYQQLGTAIWVLLTGQSTTLLGLIYGLLIALFALFGLFWIFQCDIRSAILLSTTALVVWLFFGIVSNHPMTRQLSIETRDVFFIPAYLIYNIWVGLGIARLILFIINLNRANNIFYYLLFIPLIFPLIGCYVQWDRNNERDYYIAYDFAKNLLDSMEPNAMFIGDDDMHIFPVWYMQQVKNYRTDIIVLSRTSLYKQWYYDGLNRLELRDFHIPVFDRRKVPKDFPAAFIYLDWQMFNFFKLNISYRPCYFYQNYPLRIETPLPITQVGLIYKVTESPMENTISALPHPYHPPRKPYVYRLPKIGLHRKDFWRNWAAQRLSEYHYLQGLFYYENIDYNNALNQWYLAITIRPINYRAHYQLGLLYRLLGDTEKSKNSFYRVLFINPEHTSAKEILNELTGKTE